MDSLSRLRNYGALMGLARAGPNLWSDPAGLENYMVALATSVDAFLSSAVIMVN